MNIEQLRASNANVLSVEQVRAVLADAAGECPDIRTVRRAIADGQIPSIRVGSRSYVPRLPLLAILEGEQQPKDVA